MAAGCNWPPRLGAASAGRVWSSGEQCPFPARGLDQSVEFRCGLAVLVADHEGDDDLVPADSPVQDAGPELDAVGALTAIDNTWATPLLFNPLEHGVDLAIQSGTKYLNGHADAMFGVTTTGDVALYERLRSYVLGNGVHLAPDDAWLARRGLRTLAVRLAAHERAGYALAEWLGERPEVVRVIHPGLPGCPGHDIFRRDFRGASGLFAVVLTGLDEAALARFLDGLELFGMGYSWGGFESLALPMVPTRDLPGGQLAPGETLLRLHAGLEAVDDLVADLDAAFARGYR